MTRVRRPKQQQQVTLLRLVIFFFTIGVVTLFLFRIDSDFAKKDRKRLGSRPVLLSPEQLVAHHNNNHQQDQEVLNRNGDQGSEKKDSAENGEDTQAGVDSAQQRGHSSNEIHEYAPKRYRMELANLKGGGTGTVVLEIRPSWAPIGARHFEELVENQFYDQCRFFRVLPNFVVQFGINGSPQVQAKWRKTVLQDDPVLQSNSRGTITYATSGKNTRSMQLFINKKDNKYLDKEGFAPFGLVIEGMEFVDLINDEYKEKPNQGKIQNQGNVYLNHDFPNLSYVASIREITPDANDAASVPKVVSPS
jgi:peptidyl-prolyl cis-trans isomerase A (cyclophilin A)